MEPTLKFKLIGPIVGLTDEELLEKWDIETVFHSSTQMILRHTTVDYLRKLPRELALKILSQNIAKKHPFQPWGSFALLSEISGHYPTAGIVVENGFAKMTYKDVKKSWIKWAKEKGYIE